MSDNTHFIILYVESPAASARWYEALLGAAPVESSATFAMFVLKPGLMLGLWLRKNVEPAATGGSGSVELAFVKDNAEAVRATHDVWCRRGLPIAQAPTAMDFGFTFVALDPDGHRLRVFSPEPPHSSA